MKLKTALTFVLAVLFAGILASGLALAGATDDVSPEDYGIDPDDDELDVYDPDDQLTADDIDDAIELSLSDETVAETVTGTDSPEITVQATGDRTDVTVVFAGESDGVSAIVDLQDGGVTQIVESVSPAANAESFNVSVRPVERGDDVTVHFGESNATTVGEPLEVHEIEAHEIEEVEDGDAVVFDATPDAYLAAAETQLIDEDDVLTPEEASLVEKLVTESDQVNGEVGPVDAGSEWRLEVSPYEDDFWLDTDDRVVVVEISQPDENPIAQAFVNLEEDVVERTIPVSHIDSSEIERETGVDIDLGADGDVDTEKTDG